MQALIDLVKQSPLWQEAQAEGRIEGRIEAERALCLTLVSRRHPALLALATPRIEACTDPAILEAWILAASEPGDNPLTRLLGECPQ